MQSFSLIRVHAIILFIFIYLYFLCFRLYFEYRILFNSIKEVGFQRGRTFLETLQRFPTFSESLQKILESFQKCTENVLLLCDLKRKPDLEFI